MFVFAVTRPRERAAARSRRPASPKRRHRLIGNTNKTRSEHQIKSSGPLRNTISRFVDIDFCVRYFSVCEDSHKNNLTLKRLPY